MSKRIIIGIITHPQNIRKHLLHGKFFACVLLFTLVFNTGYLFSQEVNTPEKRYIIGVARSLAPYSFLDKNGDAVGYSVDITNAIAQVMKLDIEIIIAPFGELRIALEKGEIDAMPMYYSENRKKQVDFTVPFSTVHNAIFIRKDSPAIETEEELRGKNIIVINGDIMHDFVLENNLTDKLVLVSMESEALKLLSSGDYDCALMAQLPGFYWVKKLELNNIVTVGQLMVPSEICYAVTKGNTALRNLLSEGLATLGETGEHKRIHDKWLGILIPIGVSQRTIWKYIAFVVIPLLLLIGIIIVWSQALKKQVIKRTNELSESNSRFKSIFSEAPIGIEYYDSGGNLIDINKECMKIFGVRDIEEIKGFKLFDDPNLSKESIKMVKQGNSYNYETEFDFELVKKNKLYRTSKSGKRYMNILITPYEISGFNKMGYLVHIEDINERRQAEKELEKHREHLEELVKERTKELEEKNKKLEEFNELFVNREFRIKELKDKVKELEKNE